jgi:hypothetical protein
VNPILDEHPGAEEYDLFGVPRIGRSYAIDSTQPNNGADDWYWCVWADYAPDTRCSFDGDCGCKEFIGRGFDTEEGAAIFAGVLKAGARKVK